MRVLLQGGEIYDLYTFSTIQILMLEEELDRDLAAIAPLKGTLHSSGGLKF